MAGNERNIKVKIDHVEKIYEGRKGRMVALNGIDLDIMENEFICVVGPSGCGKSTLLNIIAGLLPATSGAVYVDGKTWTARSADGSVLPAGSRVEIRRMEGVKLIVEAAQKAPDKKEEGV